MFGIRRCPTKNFYLLMLKFPHFHNGFFVWVVGFEFSKIIPEVFRQTFKKCHSLGSEIYINFIFSARSSQLWIMYQEIAS